VQVARSALRERAALTRELEAEVCVPFSAGDCEVTAPMPVPSCPMPGPRCEAGQCVAGRP
jgi:hypothetical protein